MGAHLPTDGAPMTFGDQIPFSRPTPAETSRVRDAIERNKAQRNARDKKAAKTRKRAPR